jgi:hypothetical protein
MKAGDSGIPRPMAELIYIWLLIAPSVLKIAVIKLPLNPCHRFLLP